MWSFYQGDGDLLPLREMMGLIFGGLACGMLLAFGIALLTVPRECIVSCPTASDEVASIETNEDSKLYGSLLVLTGFFCLLLLPIGYKMLKLHHLQQGE